MARNRGSSPGRSGSQRRSASTSSRRPEPAAKPSNVPAAAPPAAVPAVQQPHQPGMFAQMASTAAGVAVGSTIGHTLGHAVTGMFGGGSSSSAPETVPVQAESAASQSNTCEIDSRAFKKCLEQNSNDIGSCQMYFEMYQDCMKGYNLQ